MSSCFQRPAIKLGSNEVLTLVLTMYQVRGFSALSIEVDGLMSQTYTHWPSNFEH